MSDANASLDLITDLLAKAKAAGADAADAVLVEGTSVSVAQRLGKLENLDRSEGQDLGLRVFMGRRQAIVSSTDLAPNALKDLVERAVAMAKAAPEDPFCGIALAKGEIDPELDLDLCAPKETDLDTLKDWVARAEDAARSVDGVTNSEGAEASYGRHRVCLAISNGFAGSYENSSVGVSASVLAGTGTGMERDYDWCSAVHAEDLRDPEAVGRRAGERAVARLGAQKAATANVPVVFDPRVSGSLLRHFSGAINGAAIARGTSFLKDKMDQMVFAQGIDIVDDPHRVRGHRSKPFDAEGQANGRRRLIDDGRLTGWVLDLATSRQLNLPTTGNASRGTGGPPSPSVTNFYMEPGELSPEQLLTDIPAGFYVTEMMGFGVNGVTGDYSRGASGFWIENGELTYPVSEMTIAGNLKDMFKRLTPANDLEFRTGMDAPTIRIDGMTVAGK